MRFLIYRLHYKRNLDLAIPIILSQAGQILTGVVDNIMVGHIGITPLAACSFANSIFTNVLVFAMGFTYGLTPLVGKAYGERNYKKTSNLLRHSLVSNLFLVLFLFLLLIVMSFFLDNMGQTVSVTNEARPYFYLISFSLIPSILFFTFKQFTEGIALIRPTMVITLSTNILNIFLNYILIYGHFGFKPMGLVGAGLGTLISKSLMGLSLSFYVLFRKETRIWIKGIYKNQWKKDLFKDLWQLGIPISFQMLMEIVVFTVGAIMMGWIGEKELAAHQIAISLSALSYMVANGLAASLTIRISNLLGEKYYLRIRHAALACFHLTLLFMGSIGICFFLLGNILPLIFVSDKEVIMYAAIFITIAAIFQISDGIQVVALGALRGLKDVKIPTLITLLAYWIIAFPLEYILAFVYDMKGLGIWIGFIVGLTTAAVLLTWRFFKKSSRFDFY